MLSTDALFAVRVAYQTKVTKSRDAPDGTHEVIAPYPSTFEDALVLENEVFFTNLAGTGLTKKLIHSFFARYFYDVGEFAPNL